MPHDPSSGHVTQYSSGTRFLSLREAEARHHATPADAPLRRDGISARTLSVYQAALKYEPPGLPPVAQIPGQQSLLEQLDLDGAI
jgi:hypothetical protein